jgi:hypothetical protein
MHERLRKLVRSLNVQSLVEIRSLEVDRHIREIFAFVTFEIVFYRHVHRSNNSTDLDSWYLNRCGLTQRGAFRSFFQKNYSGVSGFCNLH